MTCTVCDGCGYEAGSAGEPKVCHFCHGLGVTDEREPISEAIIKFGGVEPE